MSTYNVIPRGRKHSAASSPPPPPLSCSYCCCFRCCRFRETALAIPPAKTAPRAQPDPAIRSLSLTLNSCCCCYARAGTLKLQSRPGPSPTREALAPMARTFNPCRRWDQPLAPPLLPTPASCTSALAGPSAAAGSCFHEAAGCVGRRLHHLIHAVLNPSQCVASSSDNILQGRGFRERVQRDGPKRGLEVRLSRRV